MSQIIEELSNRKIIKISNKLCQAQYRIKESTINVFLMLLTEIAMEDTHFRTFDIAVSAIEKKLGKQINRASIDSLCKELTGANIYLPDYGESIALCSQCEKIQEDGGTFLQIKINPELKIYLLDLQFGFTQLNLDHILALNGFYAKRIYMLLKQFSGLSTWRVKLETLYGYLAVPESYQNRYDNFKSRVLTPAIEQIKNLNDKEFDVDYREDKRGSRKVKMLVFKYTKFAKPKKITPGFTKKYSKAKKKRDFDEFRDWVRRNPIDETDLFPNEYGDSEVKNDSALAAIRRLGYDNM